MRLFAWTALILVLLAFSQNTRAGNSGLNVIVVVNQHSTNSVQLGNDYCERRGVPPQNLFRMTGWTNNSVFWSTTDFKNLLLDPLLAMISQRGLTNQAQVVLLSMDIPYSVFDGTDANGTTSSLFYGFKTNTAPPLPCFPGSCALPDAASNSYAFSEMPFAEAPPNTATTNSFLAMMLTASNLNSARVILNRGVASDSTFPTQTVYLAKTSDPARSVRSLEFDNALLATRVRDDSSLVWLNSNSTSFTNALGLLTGLANYSLPVNAFVAGAMADSLTSFGGTIFENHGQTVLLAFLAAGASGSYGTVTEPCAYTEKFPDPMDYFFQHRGFCLAESYYQSLRHPYQGLLAGEPLSAPFARPGAGDWSSLTNNAVLSGQVILNPSFAAAATNLPLAKVDLFLDGSFLQTMTNLLPTAGNLLSVTLNGFTVTNTVPTNSTLSSAITNLAAALNAQTNSTQVLALPFGDRLDLQSLNPANPGSNVTLSADSALGSGAQLTAFLEAARPTFVDTAATGYATVLITNTTTVGDWLELDFVKTNGTLVSIAVTNTSTNTTVTTLVLSLALAVNADPDLQGADGLFVSDFSDDTFCGFVGAQFTMTARSPGFAAAEIQFALTASTNLAVFPAGTNRLEDNLNDLRPRNHLYLSSGATTLPVSHAFDTTQFADGFHQLTAVACEGTSVRTQTRVSRTVRLQNTPLTATFASLYPGANITLDVPLQFAVTASATNISRIELFSTGGSVGVISNQSSVVMTAPSALLGLGLHPFYAVVTDTIGRRYQTETIPIRMVLPFKLNLMPAPTALTWQATPGLSYDIFSATNVAAPFQFAGSFTATSGVAQWPIANTNISPVFYRVRYTP